MEAKDQICKRYEAAFTAIAALDRRYYLNPCASVVERRDYAMRQAQLQEIRSRLYAELHCVNNLACGPSRRCRSLVRSTGMPCRTSFPQNSP
jgi:hypothetical protein